ncbi:hypothetical protein FIBSPDRAFT_857297 [Athelia psychrophila]|uniref:Uncharacterized protein n=1 Tax=Athelia psychrophila TaxID=1759441 RepID=A0A166MRT8_9AGAM|nr:hypothetical protein FIBSPDRAFT_857297 [Fibularhizoctonia sp. CBS 109695]
MPLINPTRFADARSPRRQLSRDLRAVQASPTGAPEIRPPDHLDSQWRAERARMRSQEPIMLNYWVLEGAL